VTGDDLAAASSPSSRLGLHDLSRLWPRWGDFSSQTVR